MLNLRQSSLADAGQVGFFQNFRGEAAEIGGGHEYLLMVEHLAQKVGAAVQVQFAEYVVEQENWFLACHLAHMG